MSPKDALAMPNEMYEQFWSAIDVIEARSLLLQMTTADFPHMKQSARQKHHKSIYKNAFPDILDNKKEVVSPAQIIEQMTKKARAASGR